MPAQWYFEHDGKPQGPFLLSQLKKLAALGRLRPTDLVWQEDQSRKIPASELKGIFSNSPPLPKTQSRSPVVPPPLPTTSNSLPPLPDDANFPHGMRTPKLPNNRGSGRPTFWQRHGFKVGMGTVGAIILFLAALVSSSAEFQEGFAEGPERTAKPQVHGDSVQQPVIARKMTKKQFLEKLKQSMPPDGRMEPEFVYAVFRNNSFQKTFGDPDSNMAHVDSTRMISYRCKDGIIAMVVHFIGPTVVLEEVNQF